MNNIAKSSNNDTKSDTKQCCMIAGIIYSPLALLLGMAAVISF